MNYESLTALDSQLVAWIGILLQLLGAKLTNVIQKVGASNNNTWDVAVDKASIVYLDLEEAVCAYGLL